MSGENGPREVVKVQVEFTFVEVLKLVFFAGVSAIILTPVYLVLAAMFAGTIMGFFGG